VTLVKELQAQGLTFEAYRKRIREEIIVQAMVGHFASSDVLISPFKIETFYQQHQDDFKVGDQVKLRMIFLAHKPNRSEEATRKLAEEILAKLESGTPFAEMASIYSDGSQRAEGGDWGWTERSVLREDLAELAFALAPGQRSGVIAKPDGCYLMWVEDARPAHVKPLTEVRDEIEETLRRQERQRLRKTWIDRLKAKSFVRYFPMT
jgi:peptidyl-prolyl cis-trans isomerase SurA